MNDSLLQRLGTVHDENTVLLRDTGSLRTLGDIRTTFDRLQVELDIAPSAVVALYGSNSIDWVMLDFYAMEAGLILVPLPDFFSDQQLRHVLDQVRPDLIVSDNPDRTDSLSAVKSRQMVCLPRFHLARLQSQQAAQLPKDTGKITFTSGSTGTPKGVCLSHQQLLEQGQRLADVVGLYAPRHLALLPLSVLLENVAGVYTPLLAGGEVMIAEPAEAGFSGSALVAPGRFLETISQSRPDSIIVLPQLLQLLVTACSSGWQVPDSLEFVAVGGSRVSSRLLASAHQNGIPAFEGYGLSECASVVSLNVPGAEKPGTAGRVLPGLQVCSRDGELVIKGNAMLGYLGDEKSWYPHEVASGDLGRVDEDGYVHIQGRSKNLMISSFGRNISPEWVESELLANPLFSMAVVFGDDRPCCVALLSPASAQCTPDIIESWIETVNAGLPDYARIQAWELLPEPLTVVSGLLTANGRPRREAIAGTYQALIESMYQQLTQGAALPGEHTQ